MKQHTTWRFSLALMVCLTCSLVAEVAIRDLKVQQRWPWNGLVDFTYSVDCDEQTSDGQPVKVELTFSGYDGDRKQPVELKTLMGDGVKEPVTAGGPYRTTWNAAADAPNFNALDFRVKLKAKTVKEPDPEPAKVRYLVIDMSGGMDAESFPHRYSEVGPDLSKDVCRTTELWLREIPAGTFMMGSPESELGRDPTWETLHQVTLTKPYFIGVFPVTNRQWVAVMGKHSSNLHQDGFPVVNMTHNEIRGSENGSEWPTMGYQVDAGSFMARLRAKTGLLVDLPTEAQWEYACRAGTTTALNSGKDLTGTGTCANMAEVGRYTENGFDGKGGSISLAIVGRYAPNAWGLYDMHGNVWEWCLDRYMGDYGKEPVTDPVGASSGRKLLRGGSWRSDASKCRSAARDIRSVSSYDNDVGLRLVVLPDQL